MPLKTTPAPQRLHFRPGLCLSPARWGPRSRAWSLEAAPGAGGRQLSPGSEGRTQAPTAPGGFVQDRAGPLVAQMPVSMGTWVMAVLLQLLPAAGQPFLQPVSFFYFLFFLLSDWLCTSPALSFFCAV